MGNKKENPDLFGDVFPFSSRLAVVIAATLATICFLLFATIYTDLDCTRVEQNAITCSLVHHTPLQTMAAINIEQPIAVDISSVRVKGGRIYTAELRSKGTEYPLSLSTSRDETVVYKATKEINNFLLHSSDHDFHKRLSLWKVFR